MTTDDRGRAALAKRLHEIDRYCHDPEDLDAFEHDQTAAAILRRIPDTRARWEARAPYEASDKPVW